MFSVKVTYDKWQEDKKEEPRLRLRLTPLEKISCFEEDELRRQKIARALNPDSWRCQMLLISFLSSKFFSSQLVLAFREELFQEDRQEQMKQDKLKPQNKVKARTQAKGKSSMQPRSAHSLGCAQRDLQQR